MSSIAWATPAPSEAALKIVHSETDSTQRPVKQHNVETITHHDAGDKLKKVATLLKTSRELMQKDGERAGKRIAKTSDSEIKVRE